MTGSRDDDGIWTVAEKGSETVCQGVERGQSLPSLTVVSRN